METNNLLDRAFRVPPRPDIPATHFFGPGIYIRRSFVPAGKTVAMHIHDYDHFSVIATGLGILITDEGRQAVKAGDVITIKAGQRHAYLAATDTIWLCIHNPDIADPIYPTKSTG